MGKAYYVENPFVMEWECISCGHTFSVVEDESEPKIKCIKCDSEHGFSGHYVGQLDRFGRFIK